MFVSDSASTTGGLHRYHASFPTTHINHAVSSTDASTAACVRTTCGFCMCVERDKLSLRDRTHARRVSELSVSHVTRHAPSAPEFLRTMPGASYEGSITGGFAWKDRSGTGTATRRIAASRQFFKECAPVGVKAVAVGHYP